MITHVNYELMIAKTALRDLEAECKHYRMAIVDMLTKDNKNDISGLVAALGKKRLER